MSGTAGSESGLTGLLQLPKLRLSTHRPVVAVLGLGYVGLPTAIGIASGDFGVVGVDVNARRLDAIGKGRVDLVPAERARLTDVLRRGELRLTTAPDVLAQADAVLICVPTPVDAHQVPDLSYVESACATAVEHARPGQTIVLTSTTYVGTTRDLLLKPLVARGFTPGETIFVAFSPERIDPGNAGHPQRAVPRILGGATPRCALRALPVLGQMTTEIHTVRSLEVAEFTKLYENTFRAVNIAFANEMADTAQQLGLDISEVIEAASTKPYGFMPFYPGAGVGGHCIPCDPHYLLWQLRAGRRSAPLVEQAMTDIAARPRHVVQRARDVLAADAVPLAGARVLVIGAAYKPGVEDVRGSPAVEILHELRSSGAEVAYHDRLVPSLRLPDDTVLTSVEEPNPADFDLVVVQVMQAGAESLELGRFRRVLDATYRLRGVPHRVVL